MDDKLRETLTRLAEAILPLNEWLKAAPPNSRPNIFAPWHVQFTPQLSIQSLELIEFIERRIEGSGDEAAAAKRWAQVEKNPLGVFNKLPDRSPQWRADRGLGDPIFGLVASGNVEVVLDNVASDGPLVKRATSRREFYDHAFDALMKVVIANPPVDWNSFRDKLAANDASLNWPANSPLTPRQFVEQFAKDLLYGLMGMFDQPPKPESTAVLAELGQHRRKGNAYSSEDAAAAVEALKLLTS